MDIKKFGQDVVSALAGILAKHGHPDAQIIMGGTDKNIVVGIRLDGKPTATAGIKGLTPNSVKRYQQQMHALGLPALGTAIEIPKKGVITTRGLSSDKLRVKVTMNNSPTVVDIPLALVVAAVALKASEQTAAIDKQEQAAGDNVDPDVTAFLAALGKKAAE